MERPVMRYSLAFKRQVVEEVEKGRLSMNGASKKYGLGGCTTVSRWIKEMGKNHLLSKVVRIETPKDVNKLKSLKEENTELRTALGDAHLEILCLQKVILAASKEYGEDIKKKYGTRSSRK